MMLLPRIKPRNDQQKFAEQYDRLLRREAKIGGKLFGPIPAGHSRQFFCLDEHTWVWHEEWQAKNGKRQTLTTRYDIRPGSILKSQNGQPYQRVEKQELSNLYEAAKLYHQRVSADLRQITQAAA